MLDSVGERQTWKMSGAIMRYFVLKREKAPAKLRLGIYYFRKYVFLIFLNNNITAYYTISYCLKRKNKKRFFSFQSMPNLNFAELINYKEK